MFLHLSWGLALKRCSRIGMRVMGLPKHVICARPIQNASEHERIAETRKSLRAANSAFSNSSGSQDVPLRLSAMPPPLPPCHQKTKQANIACLKAARNSCVLPGPIVNTSQHTKPAVCEVFELMRKTHWCNMQSKRIPFQFPRPWTRELSQVLQACIWQVLFNEQRAKIHAPPGANEMCRKPANKPDKIHGSGLTNVQHDNM